MLSHSLVIGYHGCDRKDVERVVAGKDDLKPSQNAWDWLGHGIYFWEDSHGRALRWAKEKARQTGGKIKSPAVLGAVIDLGNCLNLADTDALALVKSAHRTYKELCTKSGATMLTNRGQELKARFLDCAVIETLHQWRRHLSGDRKLRRGCRDLEATVRRRARRHGARLCELCAGDAGDPGRAVAPS